MQVKGAAVELLMFQFADSSCRTWTEMTSCPSVLRQRENCRRKTAEGFSLVEVLVAVAVAVVCVMKKELAFSGCSFKIGLLEL